MRILGIDIGNQSIKAVELDTAFGRYEIHEYHEQALIPSAEPEAGPDIRVPMNALLSSLGRKPDRVVVALPTGKVTFRNLQLPTKDKKAIGSAVAYELDDELPFPISQAIYDYVTLAQSKQGALLHIAATLSRHVESEVLRWSNLELDPEVITTEPWSYRTYINRMLAPELREKPVLLIQIGEEKTSLYVHLGNSPILGREISWGGRDLTTAIATHYGIPYDQAEKAKLDHGFVISPAIDANATREQSEFSLTLSEPIQHFVSEVKQATLTCKNLTHLPVSGIYLSGGTSLLPGLPRLLQDMLHIPVQKVQALTSLSTSGVAYPEPVDAKFLLAASLALTQVGPDRNVLINLRKGLFSKRGRGKEFNASALKGPVFAVAAAAICFFVSLAVQNYLFNQRLKDTDVQLERSVRTFFGQVSSTGVKNLLSSPSTLKKKVNEELAKQKELAKITSPNAHSPIEFIRDLSNTVPKDVVVDLINLDVGSAPASSFMKNEEQNVSATFVIPNTQVADRLATLIGPKLTGMTKSKIDPVAATEGKSGKFKITFTGKPNETAFGELNGR